MHQIARDHKYHFLTQPCNISNYFIIGLFYMHMWPKHKWNSMLSLTQT